MGRKNNFLFLILIFMLGLVPMSASAELVNFDTFPDGSEVPSLTYITDQYKSLGVIFEGPLARNIPATEPWYASWIQTNYPDAYSFPNMVSVHDIYWSNPDSIHVRFVDPVSGTPATTDYVSIRFFDTEVGSTLGIVKAYSLDGTLLAEVTKSTPLTTFDTFVISSPGIASLYLSTDGDGADIDNLEFNPVKLPNVPEFPTIAMPIIAVIGLMFLFQRRKGK